MHVLMDAIEGMISSTAMAGGEVAETAAFVMENVDWTGDLKSLSPRSQPVVDDCLQTLCENAGQDGSNARIVAQSLLSVRDVIQWNSAYTDWTDPDIKVYSQRFAWCSMIGSDAPLVSDRIEAGFSIQGADILYPAHAHQAVEEYWIIGGDSDWKIGADPWFPVGPGDTIHHDSGIRHAMQTNRNPLLCFWLWTTHLDSSVVIVRG